MPHDHPGFEYWDVNDAVHRFPVGDINLTHDEADFVTAEASFTLPQAQPKPATVAERYVGIVGTAQLWVALECAKNPLGGLLCEAVLRGRHLHFHPDHNESEAGPLQEIRLSMADMGAFGRREALAAHGPHCDLFSVTWGLRQGAVHCELSLLHVRNTVQGLIDSRARSNREAERLPRRVIVEPLPDGPAPTPAPKPKPELGPDGAMTPDRPGGLLGGLLALVRRIGRAIFG